MYLKLAGKTAGWQDYKWQFTLSNPSCNQMYLKNCFSQGWLTRKRLADKKKADMTNTMAGWYNGLADNYIWKGIHQYIAKIKTGWQEDHKNISKMLLYTLKWMLLYPSWTGWQEEKWQKYNDWLNWGNWLTITYEIWIT